MNKVNNIIISEKPFAIYLIQLIKEQLNNN